MVQDDTYFLQLVEDIKCWGKELGFQQVGITDVDLAEDEVNLKSWLAKSYHGEMNYMAAHGNMRSRPAELLPGTLRVISVRMDYMPANIECISVLKDSSKAYLSRYALGRDYHKLIRKRLTQLGKRLEEVVGSKGYRVFVDSAPVLERALANKAGIGWVGKNTMIINPKVGSYYFLGELFTDVPLPIDQPFTKNHCGSCNNCIEACPTQAFVGDKILDARRCISYLTIELKGSIPEDLRKPMGNRVFGCDDCQLSCPFNKFAKFTAEQDFTPRHQLDRQSLVDLFSWDEALFLNNTLGSPIRRAGYENWLRNLAVGLGNAASSATVISALQSRVDDPSQIVQEHVRWALVQHGL